MVYMGSQLVNLLIESLPSKKWFAKMNGDSIKNKVFASHLDQEIKFEYMKSCQDLGRHTIVEFWKENNSTGRGPF